MFGSLSLSDGMPSVMDLPVEKREPPKFRKIERKQPFVHLQFRSRKFSLEKADSTSMYVIVGSGQPSLALVLLLNNRVVVVDPC